MEHRTTNGCSRSIDSVLVEVALPKVLNVTLSTSDDSICSGSSTTLNAQIEQEIIHDGFHLLNTALWSSINGGAPGSDCGSVLGNALYFNGNGPRMAQTNGFDLSNGGRVRFHLKIGVGVAPCNNADPGEDVILEYSTNNGTSWSSWPGSTFDEASYPVFTLVDLPIPAAAFSNNTQLRISQPNHSGAGHDNWSIDDISISSFSANGLNLSWSPTASIADPTQATTEATPTVSGWYKLFVTNDLLNNDTNACSRIDSIYISVGPTFTLERFKRHQPMSYGYREVERNTDSRNRPCIQLVSE